MPELPEVQTIVDDLNKKIIGRKITGVWFDWPKMITIIFADQRGLKLQINADNTRINADTESRTTAEFKHIFEKIIKSKKIIRVRRKAKNILIDLQDADQRGLYADQRGKYILLIHQKMTGHLLVGKWNVEKGHGKERVIALEPQSIINDPYNRFVHVIFYLSDGNMLALSDMRKFAKIILGKKEDLENLPELKELGPEPLDPSFKVDKFISLISPKTGKIKQVLMDQKVISGIGNIYSDDILWLARLNPFKPANKISKDKLRGLFKAIRTILNKAIKLRGTSVSDFRDTAGKKGEYSNVRLVYQREGEKCPRNDGGIIVRKKIGGRSAHFCPICQKLA